MGQAASMDIKVVRPGIKGSLKAEMREERKIGKMSTGAIFAYVAYRHRVGLLTAGYPIIMLVGLAIVIAHSR